MQIVIILIWYTNQKQLMQSNPLYTLAPASDLNQEKRTVGVLGFVQFTHLLDFMILLPLAPLLSQALALSAQQYTMVLVAYTLAATASSLLAVGYMDRFARKPLLLGLLLVLGLAQWLSWNAKSFEGLLIGRAVAGLCGALIGATLQALIGDVVPPARRGRASGTLLSATSVATVLGVPYVLWLATAWSWSTAFQVAGAFTLLSLLLAAWGLPTARPALAVHATGPQGTQGTSVRALLRNPNLRRVLAFMALGAFSTFTVVPYLPLYLTGNWGLSPSMLPWVYLLGGSTAFLTARGVGRLVDRLGKVRTYRWFALVSVLPILLQTQLPALPLAGMWLVSTLFFTFAPSRAVPALTIAISAVPPAQRGAFMALNASVQQLACGSAALVGLGLIGARAEGGLSGYAAAGWLAVGVTALTVWLVGRIHLQDPPPQAGQ